MFFEQFQGSDHLGQERNDFNNSKSPCGPNAANQIWAKSDRVREQMWFEEFQDGRHGSHPGYQNGMILAILNLYVHPMTPIRFRLNPTYGLGGDVVWRILRWPPWGRLEYWNRTILAILNLCVASTPPIKFRLNLTYGLEGDVLWRISRWPPWISEQSNFSKSESLCRSDTSHQVSAQSTMRFRRRCRLKNFKMAWISERNDFSNSESLCPSDASH